jgi:hypothetical protein
MKRILRVSIFIVSLFLVTSPSSQAAMNGDAVNELQNESSILYTTSTLSPEPSYLPGDPGIPEAPIDNNLYVLFFAAIVYGFYQRKRLSSLGVRG